MDTIVKLEQSAHWYHRDGTPAYERECKTKLGQFRATTLADARKEGLLYSVTSVTGVLAKPQLTRWLIENAIVAALTIDPPQQPGESADDFARRVAEDARSVSVDAADLGTRFHAEAELYHQTRAIREPDPFLPEDERLRLMVSGYARWFRLHIRAVRETEKTFASLLGYGGRIDILAVESEGQTVLADLKTQTTKQGQKIRAYPEYAMQLAAYATGLNLSMDTLLWNIIVSTTEMGRVEVYDWTERREFWMRAFRHCYELCVMTSSEKDPYDPRQWRPKDGNGQR